ncbi:hypothetical protein TRVL_02063 [Trypanosoma vivax]|uniref:N-acetyltransferase ESCO zinc-finger domain-containing protein n=1 Tax=Trypanosoma vivax (strain Y486) TaxID=1055687 RepID=G0U5W3_TRYVY|nr:hypothetical protein TRVL_02063 [Trypanosoma vivax]CCC51264.1 conserved hypothetical protein [Trypanosoma vivax Y486]
MYTRQRKISEFVTGKGRGAIDSGDTGGFVSGGICLNKATTVSPVPPPVGASLENSMGSSIPPEYNTSDEKGGYTSTPAHVARNKVHRPAERVGGGKRARDCVQTCLDFGQTDVGGVVTCSSCGMMYNLTLPDDVRLHKRACRRNCRNDAEWLASSQCVQQLDKLTQQASQERSGRKSTQDSIVISCSRITDSVGGEFTSYVFDCTTKHFAKKAVMRRLVEALCLAEVLTSAIEVTFLVVVAHVVSLRLVAAVAGSAATREQASVLVANEQDCGESQIRRCSRTTHRTLCDVSFIWLQNESVFPSSLINGRHTTLETQFTPASEVVATFFRSPVHKKTPRSGARLLVNTGLEHALAVLGRHVLYGCTLCPSTQFSYDAGKICRETLDRVGASLCMGTESLHAHINCPKTSLP